MKSGLCGIGCLLLAIGVFAEVKSEPPHAEIENGLLQAKLYLPDPVNGYYLGTRFDWSGIIASLTYKGHAYYGPWFTERDPSVKDFIYKGPEIVAGSCSAIMGPVEEFSTDGSALGFSEAKAGGTFVKIGIGVLRKPDDSHYSSYRQYEIVNSGKWTVKHTSDSVTFRHELHDTASGYGYVYRKEIALAKGKPGLVIEHSLHNAGTLPIQSSVYNHNFLVLDKQPTGPDFTMTVPFEIRTDRPLEGAEVRNKQLTYKKTLEGEDRVFGAIAGFGSTAADNKFQIENTKVKAGLRISGDKPLSRINFWSIRSVIAVEPYIDMSIPPGGEFKWADNYEYYVLP